MGNQGEGWQYGFGFHWIFFLAFWGLLTRAAISLGPVHGSPFRLCSATAGRNHPPPQSGWPPYH